MKLPAVIKRMFKRNYEAASGGPRWPAWHTMHAPAAQTLAAAHLTGSRAAFAVANSPIAASIAMVYVDALLPDAPAVQFKNGNDTAAETWFSANLAALRLLVRCQFQLGEGLARMTVDRNGDLRLTVLNPEQLDRTINVDLPSGGRVIAGVEEDARGEIVAYHILPDAPDQAFATIAPARRIPAEDVIHYFEQKVPGQRRGISELAPVLTRIAEAHKLSDARLARASVAALFGGFIQDASGTAFGDATATPPTADLSLEPGALRVLPVGTTISFPTMPDEGNASELMKEMLHEICAGVGMPYALVTGNLTDTNYSSGKMGMESFKRRIKAQRASLLVPLVFEPLHRRFSLLRVLNGLSSSFGEASYLLPDFASLDPKKETEADVLAINSGLRSRAEVIAARGRNVADVDAELSSDTFVPKALPSPTQETNNA
ncbi:phage portal protein [Bradyrhizobium arachidis]|uniref:phage portal protein n=1 Tax=Bradyrhizobium arachidis TaxID=858423 RepID=UPI002163102B|nr:phage portal protein [Bradyrhizobium arachidis]UVO29923.1 phage portal protein [Bradyrhizobium arachidis]